jgi:alkyl hydroperoxide reductase subunit F
MDFSFNVNLDSQFTAQDKNTLKPDTIYDYLIIGGGPAGFSAAIYAKRKGLTVGLIAEKLGGQVMDTTSVENYPAFDFITGEDLAKAFQNHAAKLQVPLKEGTRIKSIVDGPVKTLHLADDSSYQAKSVLIATGSKPRHLNIPGEEAFYGKGVTYCAICDGPLFEGLTIAIAGGGNSAVEAAIDMAKIAEKVLLIHRSQFRADQILLEKLNSYDNVEIHLESVIQEVKGDKLVSALVVKDKQSNEIKELETNGLIVEIGYLPNSEAFEGLVEMNDRKEIIIDAKGHTNIPGIFAAGDVTTVPYKQIVIASSEGAKATLAANDYLNSLT